MSYAGATSPCSSRGFGIHKIWMACEDTFDIIWLIVVEFCILPLDFFFFFFQIVLWEAKRPKDILSEVR